MYLEKALTSSLYLHPDQGSNHHLDRNAPKRYADRPFQYSPLLSLSEDDREKTTSADKTVLATNFSRTDGVVFGHHSSFTY